MNKKREYYFEQIVQLCKKYKYYGLTQKFIARELEISPSLVSHYFDSMDDLRKELISHAVENEIVEIVAHGIGHQDEIALNAGKKLKNKAIKYLVGV